MSRTVKRLLFAAALLAAASSSAQAASCGSGTIQTVMIGAWNWQGLHIVMNHDTGTAPPATSFFATNKIRFLKSSFTDDNFKTIKAAVLLAYANGNHVQISTGTTNGSGDPDCANAIEIHLLP